MKEASDIACAIVSASMVVSVVEFGGEDGMNGLCASKNLALPHEGNVDSIQKIQAYRKGKKVCI